MICNGVPTKSLLVYYAKGGVDSCGHRDIKAIWARFGITLKEAKSVRRVNGVLIGSVSSSSRAEILIYH